MKPLARRISMLEQHRSNGSRRIHIVTAVNEIDRDQQMADLLEAGVVGARDGFLCLLGRPLVH